MAEDILIAQNRSGKSLEPGAILEKAGYTLFKTDNVLDAAELLRRSPSLFLLEAELAFQANPEAWAMLANTCQTVDIPCLLYSSSDKPRQGLEKLAPWANEIICHPQNPEEVLAWVNSQLFVHRLSRRLHVVNRELQAKKKEMEESLKSAAHIQKCLVPDHPPPIENIHFTWRFLPCANVGGDLFNAQRLDEDILMAYILDVSGHGVSSAMVAVAVAQALSTQPGQVLKKKVNTPPYYEIASPAEVLGVLDRAYPFELFEMFFTMCYLLIETRTGRIRYSNAAHPPPVLVRADGSRELLREGGTIIGMGEAMPFQMGTAVLDPGDRLYLYTDGIVEHVNGSGEMFGEERFFRRLSELRGESLDAVCDKAVGDLQVFSHGSPPEDDVTLFGIEFQGKG